MKENYYAVIMAGGIGSRFWPVSTTIFPKQFHDMLGSGQSLLQKTFSRLSTIIPSHQIQILTNERYLQLCLDQLPEITENQVVLEPAMRNTAPCILLAALKIHKENPNGIMIVAPSDHWIEDEEAFQRDVEYCFEHCQKEGHLMTLGIQPTFPNTGFGYIESDIEETSDIKQVLQFREKPDYPTAQAFLKAGNFFWNAGIFIWSVQSILDAFKLFLPEMYDLFAEGTSVLNTPQERGFIASHYAKAENISIDYGIMEKAPNVFVKKATFDWNDLGTWGALHEKLPKDVNQNAVVGAVTHLPNSKGNMIFSDGKKLVVMESLDDYIVVDNEKVLLIYPKSKEQNIKSLLAELSQKFGESYI